MPPVGPFQRRARRRRLIQQRGDESLIARRELEPMSVWLCLLWSFCRKTQRFQRIG
jgi:hypothetical protein